MIQLHPFGTPPNHVPNDVLGDPFPTWRSVTTNGAKDPAYTDFGFDHPTNDRLFDPVGHGHGPDVTAFANQVHNGPMSLLDLNIPHCQRG
jgi:hypothetical protein